MQGLTPAVSQMGWASKNAHPRAGICPVPPLPKVELSGHPGSDSDLAALERLRLQQACTMVFLRCFWLWSLSATWKFAPHVACLSVCLSVCLSQPTMFPTAQEDRKPRRWQKGVLLGSGAFGQVFIVHNVDTGEELAMKQVGLHPESGGDGTKVRKRPRNAFPFPLSTAAHFQGRSARDADADADPCLRCVSAAGGSVADGRD